MPDFDVLKTACRNCGILALSYLILARGVRSHIVGLLESQVACFLNICPGVQAVVVPKFMQRLLLNDIVCPKYLAFFLVFT